MFICVRFTYDQNVFYFPNREISSSLPYALLFTFHERQGFHIWPDESFDLLIDDSSSVGHLWLQFRCHLFFMAVIALAEKIWKRGSVYH